MVDENARPSVGERGGLEHGRGEQQEDDSAKHAGSVSAFALRRYGGQAA
jgi:hypothetical protein